jgi:hypothetical protein
MPELELVVSEETLESYEGLSRANAVELLEMHRRVSKRDDGPFKDLTEVLALHGVDLDDGQSAHLVRRAIALIGRLSDVPRSAEMDAFYERGGSR